MKVAVSIPDEIFAEAEHLSKRLKASRSEIYGRALREFLQRHSPERVTELMNQQVLTERVRKIPRRRLELIFAGIDTLLGR